MSPGVPVRTAAMAVLASLLAAGCGGGGSSGGSAAQYSVSVAVSGLSGTVGVDMGGNTLTFTSDGTNTFSNEVASGGTYAVTVSSQPATQYCTTANGSGTIRADVTVDVSCNASAGGIWQGQSQNGDGTTETYTAMADESGDLWLLDTNTTAGSVNYVYVYGGSLTVTGTTVSVSDTGEALTGTYSDGSSYGSGTMSGTVDARSMLTLTSTFKTTSGTQLQLPQTPVTLTYDPLYSQGSSLADVTGNYLENSLTATIASGGALTGRDSLSGCILTGTISTIASEYDMYGVTYTWSECNAGVNNPLEGQTFEGIGAFEPANGNTAAQFIAVTAAILTTGYIYSPLDLVLQ